MWTSKFLFFQDFITFHILSMCLMPSVLKRASVIFDSRLLAGCCRDRKRKDTGLINTRILYVNNDGLNV